VLPIPTGRRVSVAIELPARVPPHNLDAERAVLGCVLLEGAALLTTVSAQLQAADFYTGAHRAIYGAMLTLGAAGEAITVATVQEQLRHDEALAHAGGPVLLALMIEQAAIAAYLPSYLAIVRKKAVARALIERSLQLVARAFDDDEDPLHVLEQAQRDVEQLVARAAPVERGSLFPVRSLAELLAADIPEPEFHVQGWIPTKGLTFLVGDSEAYKSWWAKYLGLCKAAGAPVLGQLAVRQGPVLYISEENGEVEDKRRCDVLRRGMGFSADLPFYIASETSFNFDDPARYAALRAVIAEHRIEWIIVDSFVRVHRREEKDAGAMNAIYMDRMKPLIKSGVDLLLLHHKRKLPAGIHQGQAPSSDNDEIRGSGDLRAAAHAVVMLKTLTETTVVVRHNKARGFRKQEAFVFSLKDGDQGGVVLTHEGKPKDVLDKTDAAAATIMEYAAAHLPGFYRADVVAAMKKEKGYSRRLVDAALKKLADPGYPLKADEQQIGRTKKRFYTLASAEAEREPGDDTDVPF
jgi:hypothetical protein